MIVGKSRNIDTAKENFHKNINKLQKISNNELSK